MRFSFKENRMQFIGATGLHRKSGEAPKERSGAICSSPPATDRQQERGAQRSGQICGFFSSQNAKEIRNDS